MIPAARPICGINLTLFGVSAKIPNKFMMCVYE